MMSEARAVGTVWPLPLSGRRWSGNCVGGADPAGPHGLADYRLASGGVFEARAAHHRRPSISTGGTWEMPVVVRTEGNPTTIVPAVQSRLARLDATIPMAQVRLMADYVADDLAANRFALQLVGSIRCGLSTSRG